MFLDRTALAPVDDHLMSHKIFSHRNYTIALYI
ncbi:hypothetical protein EMIT0232MI5_60201 [Pseudomonas sp. IT-232MI5]